MTWFHFRDLLLKAGIDDAERLVRLLGLNELEGQELPRLCKGEAILIRKIAGKGDVHIPVYLPLPPHRQAIYATGPGERHPGRGGAGIRPIFS